MMNKLFQISMYTNINIFVIYLVMIEFYMMMSWHENILSINCP